MGFLGAAELHRHIYVTLLYIYPILGQVLMYLVNWQRGEILGFSQNRCSMQNSNHFPICDNCRIRLGLPRDLLLLKNHKKKCTLENILQFPSKLY